MSLIPGVGIVFRIFLANNNFFLLSYVLKCTDDFVNRAFTLRCSVFYGKKGKQLFGKK